MRLLASDIEAKGFYDRVRTKSDVHCLCSQDIETKEVFLFHDYEGFDNAEVWDSYDKKYYTIPAKNGSLDDGIKWWQSQVKEGAKLIIHNTYGYDKLIIDKIWKDNTIGFEDYHDTYVQSKVQWFSRPTPKGAKSPHGLQAYGIRCGVNKPEVTDWENMDAYKLHRVIQDVEIQTNTYLMLEKEKKQLKDKLNIDMENAYNLESKYAYLVSRQEINGAYVDKKHIESCIKDLTNKIDKLTKEIEPQLPPTVKHASSKVSRKEIAELLGIKPDRVRDTYTKKKVDGEEVLVVDKPYVKPVTNYTKDNKIIQYSAFHISYGFSPTFNKLKELREWVKNNHPDTDFKEWEKDKKEIEVEVLNKNTKDYFGVEETSDLIGGCFTRISFEKSRMTQNDVVKAFLIKLGWSVADDWNLKKDSDKSIVKATERTEIRWPVRANRDEQLVRIVKKGEPLVTSPKLGEDDFKQLPEGLGQKIAEYNTFQHRLRFISNPKDPENKGIKSFIREDGRIPCGVNNFGTETGRSAHRVWVNAAGEKSLYGNEVRRIIKAPEGRILMGIDQKSSQLSIAAMFAKNDEYYEAVASGEEEDENGLYIGESAHCYSARNFGIVSQDEWKRAVETQDKELLKSISLRRSFSKEASFGVIFGCSGKLLAKMLNIPESEGNKKKDTFLQQMGLDGVRDYLLNVFKHKYKRGSGFYIPLALGYWVYCKSDHKAINYVIQGTEALAEKLAEIKTEQTLQKLNMNGRNFQILTQHDEFLYECDLQDAEKVGKIAEKSMEWASGVIYNWYCDNPEYFPNKDKPAFKVNLAGKYKLGENYSECH